MHRIAFVILGMRRSKRLYYFKCLDYSDIAGVDISPELARPTRQVTVRVAEANVTDFRMPCASARVATLFSRIRKSCICHVVSGGNRINI